MIHGTLKIDAESDEYAAVMRLSKELFGNQDRLLVAAAVAEAQPGDLFGQALAEVLGIAQGRVGAQLKALVKAGLLVELPRTAGDRRVFYARRSTACWDLLRELYSEAAAGRHPAFTRPSGPVGEAERVLTG